MLVVRCKICKAELISTSKLQVCNCQNQMEVKEDKISAVNLKDVIIVSSDKVTNNNVLTKKDLEFQEQRRKRKVRKLDFEIR